MNNDWILLSEARSKLLRMWNAGTAVLLLFLLVQQTTGMIADVQKEVWGWFFACLLPGLLLLNGSAWLRRRTDKVLSPGAFRALFWLETLYVGALFCFFFFSRAASNWNDYGLDVYYLRSLWILTPFNLLLLAGFVLLFYTRENPFKPSPMVVMALAGAKAAAAQRNGLVQQAACLEAVRESDLPRVFDLMEHWFSAHSPAGLSSVSVLRGQYHQIKQALDLQTIRQTESQIALNRLTVGIIDLIGEIQA